ncbi:MAG: hypothetical protein RIQ72_210 [Candidatus Parcubacteria bacterium]|jgi:D-alanyl-D-alanine carboxypeptidase (penicillin-binding protein 5/6)
MMQKFNQKQVNKLNFITTIVLILSVSVCSYIVVQADAPSKQYIVDETKIKASTVLVKNITTNTVLYEKKAHEIVPLASLTKLVTAITIRDMQKSWKGLPAMIQLQNNGKAQNTADRKIRTGGYFKIDDAISYMLLTSSNFTAHSLSSQIIPVQNFISYMNFVARKHGAKDMQFVNATGLTEVDKAGIHRNSTGTATDVLNVLETIYKTYPDLMSSTVQSQAYVTKQSTGQSIVVENTNTALDQIPGIILGKTGFTDDAGGNLALLIQRGDTVYGLIIMNSTIEERFTDAAYLATQI